MRVSSIAVVVATLTLGGCADLGTSPEPRPANTPPGPGQGPSFALVEGRYPTEEEYLNEGGSLTGGIWADRPTGEFDDALTSWSSSTDVRYLFVNEVQVNLEAKVLATNGSTINNGVDSYNWSAWLPTLITVTKPLSVSISTSGHSCSITGKARVSGSAALKLAKLDVTTVWAGGVDESAPDKSLDPCVVADQCSSHIYYANGDCNESGESAEEQDGGRDGGEGGGGGGGGGGDGGGVCTLWRIDVYVSRDGGETWSYERTYHRWECS